MTIDANQEVQYHEHIVDTKTKNAMSAKVLKLLDKVLSPFEDMTEFALAKDTAGINKGYKKILDIQNSGILKKSVSESGYQKITSQLSQLKQDFRAHNNAQIALLSTEIFKTIVNHFSYAVYIKNQLHVENLDGMGFEVLSLLSAKHLDYARVQSSIIHAKKDWIALQESIHDKNLKEAFDLLFKGLEYAGLKNDKKMLKILAQMDLALVDVIEQQLKQ
jgi:hypothetical protein